MSFDTIIPMKIALVHDQLFEFGGAERVFVVLAKIFPQACIYTAFADKNKLSAFAPELTNRNIKTSLIQKIPMITRIYSPLRFLAPKIWESFDFSNYDLVISSSGWYMCKGIKTKEPTIHISYIHHPPRYLYGYETAMQWRKYWPIKIYGNLINHFLRMWDFKGSKRPDYIIVNSQETKRRIEKFYRRDAMVIYPPVHIPEHIKDTSFKGKFSGYFVTVSRLQKAKHVEIIIEAANKGNFKLKIIGDGKERKYLQTIAGPTVEFLGNIPDDQFDKLFAGSKAFLFSSVDEEFGIAPVEAMGFGVPVIAYKSGGLSETVEDGKNGFLYDQLQSKSLFQSIKRLNALSQDQYRKMCLDARKESEKYSEDHFVKEIEKFVGEIANKSK